MGNRITLITLLIFLLTPILLHSQPAGTHSAPGIFATEADGDPFSRVIGIKTTNGDLTITDGYAIVATASSAGGATDDLDDVCDRGATTNNNITLQKDDPSLVLDAATGSDSDYWLGTVTDEDGSNDDLLQIGTGPTPGTDPKFYMNQSGQLGIGVSPANSFHVNSGRAVFGSTDIGNVTTGTAVYGATNNTAYGYQAGQTATNNITFGWIAATAAANGYGYMETYGGNNDILIQRNGGNVGVGFTSVASVTSLFHVNGNMAAGNLVLGSGSITDSSGTIDFGNEYLKTTGRIGIGVTPTNPLHIDSGRALLGATDIGNVPTGIVVYGATNDTAYGYQAGQTATNNITFGWISKSSAANGYAYMETYGGNNDILIQRTGGNVGIGISHGSYPLQLLHVNGVILSKDKIYLTQTDGNEYIDSEADGDVDVGATTSIDLKAGTDITLGDGGTTNYGKFSGSGTLSFVGSAEMITPNGTTLPGSCTVGALFADTDSDDCADTGGGDGCLCICKTANTWAVIQNY